MTTPAEQAGQHEPTQANPPQWPDPQQAMRLMANLMADDVAANRFSIICCFAMPWVAVGAKLTVGLFSPRQACERSTVTNMHRITVTATRTAAANRRQRA